MPEPVDWPPDPSRDPRTHIPEVLRDQPRPRTSTDSTKDSVGKQISEAGTAWGVAFNFVATIIAGVLLGWGFDWWRSTGPWGLLGGLVLGFVVALIQIIRYSLRQDRDAAARRRSP